MDLESDQDENEDLMIEEYENTATFSGQDIQALKNEDEDEEEDEEEYEEEAVGLKDKVLGMFGKLKKKAGNNEGLEDAVPLKQAAKSDKTMTRVLKDKLPFLSAILNKNKTSNDDGDDEDIDFDIEGDDQEESGGKKKAKIKIIHIVIGVLLIVFVLLPDDEETPAPVKSVKKISKTKSKKISKLKPKPVAEVEKPKPVEKVVEEPIVEEPIVEDPIIEEPVIEQPIVAEPQPDEVEPLVEEPIIDMGQSEGVESIDETVVPQKIIEPDVSTEITKRLLKDLEVKLKEERKEQELVEALEQVSAPSYDTQGRGLVYNCKDKHWACIEKATYPKCRQNYSWNKSQSLETECYPFAVLESAFDCATVQQEKIDTIGDTDFCGR